MFDLKELIEKAFKTIRTQGGGDINEIEVEMLLTDSEPIFKCYEGEDIVINEKTGEKHFRLIDLVGFMKYSMLSGMAEAFGGLNNIVNAKINGICEKYKFKFDGVSLLFFYEELQHDEFRIVNGDDEQYINFSEFD